ncbi:MAG: PD-(D/E)XK nuclease family protein [Actinobacteria bacterium]|nr:PD-(D/E)XK nuclease family protein [Actinomycetota bacterium]MCA1807238.1 PD-(D/E)XK nuclease family protein [Actinomycetota bacterium]
MTDQPGLYTQDGEVINTHSMLKTFRRCPKQAQFKYVYRLKPRLLGSPLKRGVWIHSLLEAYHGGGDWQAVHKQYCGEFSKLFDEEKEYYGDMPREIETIMRSYIWHYKDDPWVFHEVETQIEARLPNGWIYRGKVDSIVETQFGLFLVDHKSHKTLPDHNFRLLDSQSALYLWAAIESGIPVRGFIWNYIRWKAPSVPVLLKDGSRLSKSACDTDYPTYVRALKRYKEENPQFKITQEYRDRAVYLRNLRYEFGKPQASSFFRRDVLEKSPEMLQRVMLENYHTARRMNSYDFSDNASVERVVERSCTFSCSYVDVCAADIMGGNIKPLIKQNYTVGDPNDYYNDRAGDHDKEQR